MKKQIKKTVEICDVCKKLESWYKCQKCGKAFCYDCRDGLVEYSDGIFWHSEQGRWCKECNAALEKKPTPVFEAYRAIAFLQSEYNAFEIQFKERSKTAEDNVKRLIGR